MQTNTANTGGPTTSARRSRGRLTLALALAVLAVTVAPAHAQTEAAVPVEPVDAVHQWRERPHGHWLRAPAVRPQPYRTGGVRDGRPFVLSARVPWGRTGRLEAGAAGALFARWLERAPDAGPVAPGLVGRVVPGTEVRLQLYDGDPGDDGTLLATLTYVAGTDDLVGFHAALRAAASDATHVVIDVLGRTVALPTPEQGRSDAVD